MIELLDGRLVVATPMLMDRARALLEAGCALLHGEVTEVNLSSVDDVDSSALAVMLGWMRFVEARGASVHFTGVSDSIRSLADLYGLTDILPLA